MSSKRSYLSKCTIKWKESWSQEKDSYKDIIGDWASRVSDDSAKCNWCKYAPFKFSNLSITAFKRHSKLQSHMRIADGRNRRLPKQRSIEVAVTVADDEDDNDLGNHVCNLERRVKENEESSNNHNISENRENDTMVGDTSQYGVGQDGGGAQRDGGGGSGNNGCGLDRGGGVKRRKVVRPPSQANSAATLNDRVDYAET